MGHQRVLVAMSGGVDSSVAAALLNERGYEVTGVTLRLWAEKYESMNKFERMQNPARRRREFSFERDEEWQASSRMKVGTTVPLIRSKPANGGAESKCCSYEAVRDARQVCHILGIPHYSLNFEREFRERVVNYFCEEYARGHTPNPCLPCNRYIRFGLLLKRALALGADYLATGHYARVRSEDGRYRLLKGIDPRKDQSYFLYMLGQEQLRHILLPIGDYTKDEVRAMARERRLPVAEKPESQEICFIPDNDYRRFLREHVREAIRPGPIVDTRGKVIGRHQGIPFYTIGQRRGLGIAAGEPLYVLEIDAARNALIVGTASELGRRELIARDVNFIAGEAPAAPLQVTAKIRHKAVEAEATVIPLGDDRVKVAFARPQRDITPGQAVVFYRGEVVVGGGIIE